MPTKIIGIFLISSKHYDVEQIFDKEPCDEPAIPFRPKPPARQCGAVG